MHTRDIRNVIVIIFLALIPNAISAQILISEFLYDAPGSDTNQEWVELYNAGSTAVDLTKWKINDGSNHVLNVPPKNGGTGSITLNAGSYIILADDAPTFLAGHSNISASVIDTTLSLPNTSGTVSLINESGVTEDSISYTKDIGAAGDGNSLQRTSASSATFSAGAASPGTGSLAPSSSGDSGTTSMQNDQNTSGTTSTSQTTQAPTSSYVPPPEPTIFADAGADRTVIVGADVEFDGRAYNRNKEPVDHVRFLWNFGDGATAEGPSVLHHFEYPGQYAVMLYIAEDRTSVSDKIIVTAEPARLAFSAISDGSVSIQNLAGRDLDLSRWIVRQLGREFMLPEHSIILAGQSMHISQKTLGFWSQLSAELDYPNGVMALRAGESTTDAPDIPAPAPSPVAFVSKAPLAAYTDAPSSVLDSELVPSEESDRISATDTLTSASSTEVAAAASALSGGSYTWWLGALGLALAGGGALLAARRAGRREWDIIEEK